MPSSAPCTCHDEESINDSISIESITPNPSMIITTSEFTVSVKEVFILSLFFILMLYSFVSFYRSWNKNYGEFSHIPNLSRKGSDIHTDTLEMGKYKIFQDTFLTTFSGISGVFLSDEENLSFKRRSFSNVVRVSTFQFLVLEFQPHSCMQAASWRENSIKHNSCQDYYSTRMTQPRTSLSTSDLFSKTNQTNL